MVVYGLLGYPLRYSLSPALHQAAYRASGRSAAYLLWPTAPEALGRRVAALRQRPEVGGFNVTVPHKTAIMPLLDACEATALALQAVNTVARVGERLIGYNTDQSGFRASLRETGVPVTGREALVLGAGGAARSVCHALLQLGVGQLHLANRTRGRAERLVDDLRGGGRLPPGQADRIQVTGAEDLPRLAGAVNLVVNCTASQDPWATFALTADDFWPRGRGWAVDLAYGRMLAGFLTTAGERGWQTLSGAGMLLWQAAHAWQIWTGEGAPVAAMRQALTCQLADGE